MFVRLRTIRLGRYNITGNLLVFVHVYEGLILKLDEEECQQIEFLVFCTCRNVARAAGEFLKERLILAADEEIKTRSKSKRGGCFIIVTVRVFIKRQNIPHTGGSVG